MTATGPGTADRSPDPPDSKQVLVIDPGPEFLAYARLRLQERGYAVTTTNPTRRTFEMAAALAPDAIVCGLGTCAASIIALAERLTGDPATAGIPLILTAIHPDLLDRTRELPSLAACRFRLLHPVSSLELLAAVEAPIGRA